MLSEKDFGRCNLSFLSLYIVFNSSHLCISLIFNVEEFSSSFFFDTFLLPLGCKAFCIVLVSLSFGQFAEVLSSSISKMVPSNLQEAAQVFILLMRFLLQILFSTGFFVLLRYSFFDFFFLSPPLV